MQTVSDVQAMQSLARSIRAQGKTIALVPTMGFLHPGHLSLMEEGRRRGDVLVISIFVNPAQFGAGEDFEDYPRDPERDRTMALGAGVDVLFAPPVDGMYPPDFQTSVNVEKVTKHLCGIARPTHFKGVTTVVCKLFNIVTPRVAIFGEKDFQQLVAIRQMVADLNLDTEVVGMPICREEDGLAMSSRNRYLTPDERKAALCLSRSLKRGKALFDGGERRAEKIIAEVTAIIEAEPLARIDYVELCDGHDLTTRKRITGKAVLALAVHIGRARLIDNTVFDPSTG